MIPNSLGSVVLLLCNSLMICTLASIVPHE